MTRITKQQLTIRAERACKAVGLDFGPHYENRKAIVGRVALSKGLSGWDIHQVVNEGGGIRQINGWCNTLKASEMLAFLDGLEKAAELLAKVER